MNNTFAVIIYVFSGFVAAVSQLILKLAAAPTDRNKGYRKYLNWKIILAYLMFLITVFLNMAALRYMPYKNAPVLSSLSYIFVVILGRMVLHEKMNRSQIFGVIMIFMGMGVFYFG